MATGVLTVLSMQTLALSRTLANTHLLQAEWLLNDMLERMKANPAGFASSLSDQPTGQLTPQCETVSGCSPVQLAAHDLAYWYQRVETLLPGGGADVVPATLDGFPDSTPAYQLRVHWQNGQDALTMPVSSGVVVLQ